MNKMLGTRCLFPAAVDISAYSCIQRFNQCGSIAKGVRLSSTISSSVNDTSNEGLKGNNNDEQVNPKFINRNPRNLEFLGYGRKRKGWKFQFPSKNYYHRVLFEKSNRHTMAKVEHANGKVILSASTKEFAVGQHLYSYTDVSAAENIGRVLAQRCQESGITCMILEPLIQDQSSEKFTAFSSALEEGGIELEEPEEYVKPYQPGIDYDNVEEVEQLEERRSRVSQPDILDEYRRHHKENKLPNKFGFY